MTHEDAEPPETPERRVLGLVLSGGGARGMYQAGVIEALSRDPRFGDPLVVSGTSAGAVNASLLAADHTAAELVEFWRALAREPPIAANQRFFDEVARKLLALGWDLLGQVRPALPRSLGDLGLPRWGTVFSRVAELLLTTRVDLLRRFLGEIRETSLYANEPLRRALVEAYGHREFVPDGGHRRLGVSVVTSRTGKVVRYVNHPVTGKRGSSYHVVDRITVDMVVASSAIPLLLPPVTIEDGPTWDGGVLVNTPMAPAVALGATEIVPVLVDADEPRNRPLESLDEAIEAVVSTLIEHAYQLDRKLLLARNRVGGEAYHEVKLYRPIRPARSLDTISLVSLDRAEALYDEGRRAGERWLEDGPLFDT